MIIYLIILAYLLLMLASGFIGYKQSETQTPEDYFLANRGLGALVMFFTFIATNFSAFFFLGFAGAGYRIGYAYYAMMGFGTAFAALSFYLVGYQVWKLGKQNGYVTPAELMGDLTGSKTVKLLFLIVMVFFSLPYMAIQPIGGGIIVESLTDGAVSRFTGAVVLTIFTVIYVFIGGMRTVAITDMIQGILMFVLMFLAVMVIGNALGGITTANQQAFALKPELFSRGGGGNYFTPQKWFSLMSLWILCVPMFPQMFMRFYVAKDLPSFKTSTILYALVPLVLFICPVMIGVLGHLSFPGLEGKAADDILPMMMNLHAPAWLAAVIMTGALAAFMSTLDSQLLAISTILTRDFYLSFINPETNFKKQVIIGRVLVVLLAIVALAIAYQPPATIYDIAKNAFTGLAVLFPASIAILHFREYVRPWACALSIVVGELLLLGIFLGNIPTTWLMGFDAIVPIILVSTLILLIGGIKKKS